MSELETETPTIEEILHFQNLTLLRIYDVQMHLLREANPNLAKRLEELHEQQEFGVRLGVE